MCEPEIINLGEYRIMYLEIYNRIEAKVIFDKDHISQKLIFTLMRITHDHGFGCSEPFFGDDGEPTMTFLIGTCLPTKRSVNKYSKKLRDCLVDIREFYADFLKQLDFSRIDISMFGGIELDGFHPEHVAALRDQHYGGSWKKFYDKMISENRDDDAELVQCCIEFEQINNKDIGFVGYKLGYMLEMLDEINVDNAN